LSPAASPVVLVVQLGKQLVSALVADLCAGEGLARCRLRTDCGLARQVLSRRIPLRPKSTEINCSCRATTPWRSSRFPARRWPSPAGDLRERIGLSSRPPRPFNTARLRRWEVCISNIRGSRDHWNGNPILSQKDCKSICGRLSDPRVFDGRLGSRRGRDRRAAAIRRDCSTFKRARSACRVLSGT